MRKNKQKIKSNPQTNKNRLLNSAFQIKVSDYSKLYKQYMIKEYHAAQMMIRKLIQLPCCREYYLRFPLQGLIRGVVKKMMLNSYQVTVFGFFLEHIEQWSVGRDIFLNLAQFFPDIIHVNQPTQPQQLKQISMFLYFSSYSVKQFLCDDMTIYTKQMRKIFPQFERLHTHWVNNQSTVNFAISPRALNQFYKKLNNLTSLIDYNTCVDKILQISPCYDLSNRQDKKKLPDFGYMQNQYGQNGQKNSHGFIQYNNRNLDNSNSILGPLQYSGQGPDDSIKVQQIPEIDLMDLKYDGGDI